MNLLVTYDVNTLTPEGRRRLRRVAKVCEGYGQRVQYSVFEVQCSRTAFARMATELNEVIDLSEDSLRIYDVGPSGFADAILLGRLHELPSDASWTL